MRIFARDLLKFDNPTIWDNLRGEFTLVFDDGEIETSHHTTCYSHVFWAFHREFPDCPLLKRHHVDTLIGRSVLTADTHRKLFDNIVWELHDLYRDRGLTMDSIVERVYWYNNQLHNECMVRLGKYIPGLDIRDFIEVMEHPIVRANEQLLKDEPKDTNSVRNQQIIDQVTDNVKKVITSSSYLPNNPVVRAVQSNLVRAAQAYQSLGVRGYLTDTDSKIFPYPIMTGWINGLHKIHDVLIESRSAAKALFNSKAPLQDAEYTSRKYQIVGIGLKTLHPGDCGSDKYLTWFVKPVEYGHDNSALTKGDLQGLVGKYYINPKTNKLDIVREDDTHLIGTTIKIRSPIAGCYHHDPYGICSTCFGEMADNLPPRTNIGYTANATVAGESSQNILSTKHYDGSAVIETIVISTEDRPFIRASADNSSYILLAQKNAKKIQISISANEAMSLTDIMDVKDVHELEITRVTAMTSMSIVVTDKHGVINYYPVCICIDKRLSSFTHRMLAHIKKVGWTIDTSDDKGRFLFDMDGWDFDQPITSLPFRHVNMSDHARAISEIIESRTGELKARNTNEAPEAILADLYDVVNKRLDINLADLEVMLLGSMVVDSEAGDFRIPKPWTSRGVGVTTVTIPNRSLSGAMAFQDHSTFLTSPSSFYSLNRPSLPMDVFICPQEVVEDYRTDNAI